MANSYNIKLKKGDVEIEVFGPDKEFVSSKFKESILVAFDKSEVFKEAVNQLPIQVAEQVVQENANVEVQQIATVEDNQVIEVAPVQQTIEINSAEPAVEVVVQAAEPAPVLEASEPAQVVSEVTQVVEAVQPVEIPVQETVVNTEVVQAAAQPIVQETVEVVIAEPVVEVAVVAPVEAAPVVENVQVPQLGKLALANAAQVSEDALSKVYTFKKDGFKAYRESTGTTALKQTSMTKLVLIASEYLDGVTQLSGKALGKHMKAIGTGNLATNLKKDSGIVKEKGYRLNDAGKKATLELIKSLSQN